MELWLLILIIIGGILLIALIAGGGFFLYARKNPEQAGALMTKVPGAEGKMKEQGVKQIAANPELLHEVAGQVGGSAAATQMSKQLLRMPEQERERYLENLMSQAESGASPQQLTPPPRPISAEEQRARAAKKAKARAKRKATKKKRKH